MSFFKAVIVGAICSVWAGLVSASSIPDSDKDPLAYFRATQDNYYWLSDDTKKMLCMLPPFEDVDKKLTAWHQSNKPEEHIDIEAAKKDAKSFYQRILGNSELGKYLKDVAGKVIDNAEYTSHGDCFDSEVVLAPQDVENAPPYLRIYNGFSCTLRELSLVINRADASLNEDGSIKSDDKLLRLASQVAKEKYSEYDDFDVKFNIKQVKYNTGNGQQIECKFDVCFETPLSKQYVKLYDGQPDFSFEEIEKFSIPGDANLIKQTVWSGVQEVSEMLLVEKMGGNKKEVFKDPNDQKKYNEWVDKTLKRLSDPNKVHENYIAKISGNSTREITKVAVHETGHILENAYLIKNKLKRGNENLETAVVYIEMQFGDVLKNERLVELYQMLFYNVALDRLMDAFFVNLLDEPACDELKEIMDMKDKINKIEIDRMNGLSPEEYEKSENELLNLKKTVGQKLQEFSDKIMLPIIEPLGRWGIASAVILKNFSTVVQSLLERNFAAASDKFGDIDEHTYAVFNALQVQKLGLPMEKTLEKLILEEPAKLTPDNFHELTAYLMSE
ncbi:MAG: hypothetical protein IJ599_01860 [Alphaproteobacteria bacterium]|nr:hypothetical protein [Alphaproteobacteria bacterium]